MDLTELNLKFGNAEQTKDVSFFEKHLSDRMVFRRASGVLSGKADFLNALVNPGLVYHEIKTEVIAINESEEIAAVKAFVTVDMVKDGTHIQGSFANFRFFEREKDTWKLFTWYNEKV